MKLIILITGQESTLRAITQFIPAEYLLLEGPAGQKGLQLINEITSGVVLVDNSITGVSTWLKEALSLRPDLTYLGLAGETTSELSLQEVKAFYDQIRTPFQSSNIRIALERALEREQLRLAVENYKKTYMSQQVSISPDKAVLEKHTFPARHDNRERVLCEFSRALNNNFNRDRLLELFLNAVVELVPVGKLSILLDTESLAEYTVVAQRGLDPSFCEGLHFKLSAGLLVWLAREGRILHIGDVTSAPAAFPAETYQEMQLLQAVVCIPLIAHGQLVGALNLGSKVTGAPFSEEELQALYVFCGNVAVALRDIELHHQMRDQKSFIENVLQHMNSGVIAIDAEERIITFNPRAGEILALTPQHIIGRDLRLLPSPLGDLLYETLITGKARRKEEFEPASIRIPLEINTYQLLNVAGDPLGSVMIFEDLTPRKMLEKEKRQAAQLDVLNKFVGQLAHEIKNPMVAVQTFAELLPEKYADQSFREFYASTVRQELKRLNELVEQLIAFSTSLAYDFDIHDLYEILYLGFSFLQEQGLGQKTTVETALDFHNLKVRADKTLLARAISYILRYLFRAIEGGGEIQMKTDPAEKSTPGGSVCILLRDCQTKEAPENVKKIFDPLTAYSNGYLSLGPPVGRKIIEDHGGHVLASLSKENYLEVKVFLPIYLGKEG